MWNRAIGREYGVLESCIRDWSCIIVYERGTSGSGGPSQPVFFVITGLDLCCLLHEIVGRPFRSTKLMNNTLWIQCNFNKNCSIAMKLNLFKSFSFHFLCAFFSQMRYKRPGCACYTNARHTRKIYVLGMVSSQIKLKQVECLLWIKQFTS